MIGLLRKELYVADRSFRLSPARTVGCKPPVASSRSRSFAPWLSAAAMPSFMVMPRELGVDNKSREFHALKEDIGVVLDETFVPEILCPSGRTTPFPRLECRAYFSGPRRSIRCAGRAPRRFAGAPRSPAGCLCILFIYR